uniref:Uncharacterized protein n=1 Tax=Cacopsylla melanoneura TaxID=428564 RepID=A0A8D8Z4Z8_9HEMI
MTNNIVELNGSESSELQVICEGNKSHYLIYKGTKFIYSNPTNGTFIYKCHETRCPMKIKVDKDKRVVLGKAGAHENHSVSTPSPRYNRSNTGLGGKITSTPLGRKDKASNKLKEDILTKETPIQNGRLDKSNNIDCFETVLDIGETDHSRDAPTTINETCAQGYKSVIINPEQYTSNNVQKGNESKLEESNLFKIKYEELSKLRDSLIDKIVEKERTIVKHEHVIKELKEKIESLEDSAVQTENTRRLEEELTQSKSETTKLKTIISTLEAGWEVDKLEVEKLKSTLQNHQTESTTSSPHTKKPRENRPQYGNPKPGPSRILVSVLGDSHVRGLEALLKSSLPKHYDVTSHFKPGSRVEELNSLKIRKHKEEDIIVLISGTNDVSKTSMKSVKESIDKFVDKHKTCTLVIVLVPLRRHSCNINSHITDFNAQISSHFKDNKKIVILDPNKTLTSSDYVPDNLHLNKIGKNKIVKIICDRITPTTDKIYKNTNQHNNKQVDKNKKQQRQSRVNHGSKHYHVNRYYHSSDRYYRGYHRGNNNDYCHNRPNNFNRYNNNQYRGQQYTRHVNNDHYYHHRHSSPAQHYQYPRYHYNQNHYNRGSDNNSGTRMYFKDRWAHGRENQKTVRNGFF